MFNIFSKKFIVGLDINDHSLKIVQFDIKNGKRHLISRCRKELPVGLVVSGEIKDESKLVAITKKAIFDLKGESLHTANVATNLPEEKVFLRMIQLPKIKKEEINEAVKWEAEANIPLNIDEVYLDWQVIAPAYNHLDHLDVLIAAAPRYLVDNYLSFLRKSGLKPIALEPESAAITRSLLRDNEISSNLIVCLGGAGTNLVIFSAGAIRFTFHIPFSTKSFIYSLAKELKVDEQEAMKIKIKYGLDKTQEKIYRVLDPLISDLAKKIEDYIAFYHDHATHIHGPDGVINRVILCGSGSLLKNLTASLEEKLKLKVEVGNPFINISAISTKPDFSKEDALSFTTAIGLAMRDF